MLGGGVPAGHSMRIEVDDLVGVSGVVCMMVVQVKGE